jgi:hypothetical protein
MDLTNLEKASRCVATNSMLVVGQLPPSAVICCFNELLWTSIYMYMCVYIYICMCVCVCMYVCLYVCVYVRIYMCVCVCVCKRKLFMTFNGFHF